MSKLTSGMTRAQIAWRAAQDLPDGALINLGIGMPVAVSNYVPSELDIFFQSENGVIGVGPEASPDEVIDDLVDAGSRKVTLRPGASIVDSAQSFAMIRGGHIDITVLGAFEVAANGDLANWDSKVPHRGALVGGAMDLAVGAKQTWAMMAHNTRDGGPRLRQVCSLPLTAAGCVTRIYTDIAVVDVINKTFVIRDLLQGVTQEELASRTEATVKFADNCGEITPPDLGPA